MATPTLTPTSQTSAIVLPSTGTFSIADVCRYGITAL